MAHGTSIQTTTTALIVATLLGLSARAEDRLRLKLGTTVAREAQPKPPRAPRPPDLRGTIAQLTADAITIETPTNTIKKEWTVPVEDILEVFLDGEPEELRSARGMVASGDGAAALEQLAPAEAGDRAAGWDQATDLVKAERTFVKAAANAQVAIRTGGGLDAALAGMRDFLRVHPQSHHVAFAKEVMGDVLARMGRPDDAIAAYATIGTQAPARRIRADGLTGRLQLDRKQLDDARKAFERAIAVESPPGDLAAALEKRRCIAPSIYRSRHWSTRRALPWERRCWRCSTRTGIPGG